MNYVGLEGVIFRLKTSFSHRKDELISEIKERNATMYDFLHREFLVSRTSTSSRARSEPGRTQDARLLSLQQDAKTLYEAFKRHLDCRCASEHTCGITVSDKGGNNVHINLLFHDPAGRTQLKITSVPAVKIQASPQSAPVINRLDEVSKTNRQLVKECRLERLRRKSPKALHTLAASSFQHYSSLPSPHMATADSVTQGWDTSKTTSRSHWLCSEYLKFI